MSLIKQEPSRPELTRLLLVAVLVMAGVNAWIVDRHCRRHGTTPTEVAAALWRYKVVGVFVEPDLSPVSLGTKGEGR